MLTKKELREMAKEIEADLLENGDPLSGADWSVMQVVRAYLAEHQNDDDEPVTMEWLEEVGLGKEFDPVETLIGVIEKGFGGDPQEGDMCEAFKTRGDVRRLCRGIKFDIHRAATEGGARD